MTNNGPGNASEVTLTDSLPEGASPISASVAQGNCIGTTTVVCSLENLASGSSATATISITTLHAGAVTNTAAVSANETDLVTSNNSDSVVTTVNPLTDLEVTKAENSHPVTLGSNLSYTITVRNDGPSTSTSVVRTDDLPSGVSYIETANGCAEAGGVVSCALGDLAATKMATGVIQVTVLSASAGTVLTNTASATSTSPDDDVSNNTATITTTIQDGISVPSLSAWGTVALFGAVIEAFAWRLRRRQTGLAR